MKFFSGGRKFQIIWDATSGSAKKSRKVFHDRGSGGIDTNVDPKATLSDGVKGHKMWSNRHSLKLTTVLLIKALMPRSISLCKLCMLACTHSRRT